jgi:hypothetical protein
LHGNDSKLVFFVDPDKECLIVVVEDATSFGPVVFQTTRFEIFVTTFEEEMVSN